MKQATFSESAWKQTFASRFQLHVGKVELVAGAGAGFRGGRAPAFLRGTCQSSVKSGGFMGRLKHGLLARTSRATSRCALRDAQVSTENSLDILKRPFNPDICANNTKPLSCATSFWSWERVPGQAKAPLANLLERFFGWGARTVQGALSRVPCSFGNVVQLQLQRSLRRLLRDFSGCRSILHM